MLTLINEAIGFKWKLPQDRETAIPVHVAIGLIILSMTFVRLAIRQVTPPPSHPVGLSTTMKMGDTIGHFVLYALVFYMATIGLLMAAISPVDIRLFSGFNVSAFAPASPELLAALRPLHFAGAVAFVGVLIGHVSAALWHHLVLKDDILVRMLPFSGFAQKILDRGKAEAWRSPSANQVNWSRKSTWFRDNRSVS